MGSLSDALGFVQGMETHSHVILFYDSYETKDKIVYRYLSDGLKQGRGIVYVCSDETPEQVKKGLRAHGVDVEPNLKSGNIAVHIYDKWYIEKGRVEPLRITSHWNMEQRRLASMGLGLRAYGDTACFFTHDKVRDLLRYEYSLHKVLSMPMDVICGYNLKTIVDRGYTDMIMPLVRAHGKAIFTAEGGSMVLEPQGVEDSDLERLLDLEI
jgi:hypothetical protein